MTNKALSPEENDALRVLVRRLLDERFGGVIARAAKAWGVSGPFVSEFLGGNRGAGMKLLDGLQQHTGRSLDNLLGRQRDDADQRPVLANARGWADAESRYREQHPHKYPPEAYELARGAALTSVPEPITEDFVADVVMVLWKHHRDPSIAARQQKRLDAAEKTAVTRHASRGR